MKTPPFLLGAVLLFWGTQTGFALSGAIMGIVLELAHLIKTRWEFSEKEYNRIFDLCGLLLLGAGAIATTSEEIRVPALALALWFPFIFFPIMAAQAYGSRDKLTMRTLNWFFLRRRKSGLANKELNISYIYLGLCLLSASASSPRRGPLPVGQFGAQSFYFVVSAFLILAFVQMRSRRVHGAVWMTLIACVLALGQMGHLGLQELQKQVEALVTGWMGRFARLEVNLMESQTAIGRIGELKLSDRIVLRVEPENGARPPDLLRQMSYDLYKGTAWRATRQDGAPLSVDAGDIWKFVPDVPVKSSARISGTLHRGAGVLALPPGTIEIRDLPVGGITTNSFGMAKVNNGLKFYRFLANSAPGATFDAPPSLEDWLAPEVESAALQEIVENLGLVGELSVDEKLRIINRFFQDNFSYSTFITTRHIDRTGTKTPLEMFLTETRSGHCEYFATAAVLLARKAGIPARYATGFAVQETSGIGDMYVVRERHAHAWALVYRNGIWENFDTTPPSWEEIEAEQAPFWQPLKDLWSRLGFEFLKWRYSETSIQQYALWLLVPLGAFLIWRIVFNKRKKAKKPGEEDESSRSWPGLDSELYLMEEELGRRGLLRKPLEPMNVWRGRVLDAAPLPAETFDTACELHARYRFDPKGLNSGERDRLRTCVLECLQILKAAKPSQDLLAEASSQAG